MTLINILFLCLTWTVTCFIKIYNNQYLLQYLDMCALQICYFPLMETKGAFVMQRSYTIYFSLNVQIKFML
jgi:hypothetical protein